MYTLSFQEQEKSCYSEWLTFITPERKMFKYYSFLNNNMKKEMAIIALGLILLIPIASAGIFDWLTGKSTTQTTEWYANVGNTGPLIIAVYNATDGLPLTADPFEASSRTVNVKFEAYDHDNSTDLNDATALARFYMTGETERNASCSAAESAGRYRNYTCAIKMWYWDRAGTWTTNFSVADSSGNQTFNDTVTFTYNLLPAFVINPTNLTFNTLTRGAVNQVPNNHPTYLNNTGNNLANVTLNATNLAGNLDSLLEILASDFKASQNSGDECSRTALVAGDFTEIKNSSSDSVKLTRGNLSAGSGIGQQTLYYCLTVVNETLTKQAYTTSKNGAWTIKIVQGPA